MSYHDHCEKCGIMLEPDFDDEDGMVCAQCKKNNPESNQGGDRQ